MKNIKPLAIFEKENSLPNASNNDRSSSVTFFNLKKIDQMINTSKRIYLQES
jgi:hypothetical protein